jgi:hypothetical protein
MRRRALVATFFVAMALINTYPLILHPGSLIGEHGDAYFSVWRLAWVAHQLRADPWHLFDANIFYPHHDTLAYSDAMILPAVALAPLRWAGLDPVLIYNLTLIAAFAASGMCAYVLVRELTGSTAAGMLGGVLFAFSAHRLEHFNHLELQFAFWIPLAVLAWHRAVTHGRRYVTVGVLAAAQILCSIYQGVFLVTWLAVVTAVWFFRAPVRGLRSGAAMLLPPMLVLAIYSVPYMRSRSEVGDRPVRELTTYSAEPGDFASAPANSVLYGWTEPFAWNERHLFPGFVGLVLLIVGLWPPLDRVRIVHAVGLALAIDLTLGFNGGLYRLLYDWVLPFRGLRVPARADILVLLGTAVFAGYGLTRLVAELTRPAVRTALAAGAIGLASVECLARPVLVPVETDSAVEYSWLKASPDAVLFEWPVTVPRRLWNMVDVRYMYRSTLHWRPLLNGYSGFYPSSYLSLLNHMRAFPDTATIAELQRRGATVIVVHEVRHSRPSYGDAFSRLIRDPNVRVLAEEKEGDSRVAFFRLLPSHTPDVN